MEKVDVLVIYGDFGHCNRYPDTEVSGFVHCQWQDHVQIHLANKA